MRSNFPLDSGRDRNVQQPHRGGGGGGYNNNNNYNNNNHRGWGNNNNNNYNNHNNNHYNHHNNRGRFQNNNNNNNNNYNRKRGRDDSFEGQGGYSDKRPSLDGGPLSSGRTPAGAGATTTVRYQGGMVPHPEPDIPEDILNAKQLILSVTNPAAFSPDHDFSVLVPGVAQALLKPDEDNDGVLLTNAPAMTALFSDMLSTLPMDGPTVAALLAAVHKLQPVTDAAETVTFAQAVLGEVQDRLVAALGADDVPTAKLLLRAVAVLGSAGALSADSLATLLTALLDLAQDGSQNKQAALISTYLLARTLPYAAAALARAASTNALLIRTVQALESKVAAPYRSPFAADNTAHAQSQAQTVFQLSFALPEDSREALLSQAGGPLGAEGEACWDSLYEAMTAAIEIGTEALRAAADGQPQQLPGCFTAIWLESEAEVEADAEMEGSSSMPLILRPELADVVRSLAGEPGRMGRAASPLAVSTWLNPKFAVFDWSAMAVDDSESGSGGEKPGCFGLSLVEKCCVTDFYRDVLHFFKPVICPDGAKTGSLELLWKQLVAVERCITKEYGEHAFTGDELVDAGSVSATLQMEFVVVELLLQLVSQPHAANRALNGLLFRVNLELVKRSLNRFRSAVTNGILLIHQLLESMDTCAVREYINFFVFYLSNTQIKWPYWQAWNEEFADVESSTSVRLVFCRTVVDKLCRVFDPLAVRNQLPTELHHWVDAASGLSPDALENIFGANEMEETVTETAEVRTATLAVVTEIKEQMDKNALGDEMSTFLDQPNAVLDAQENADSWRAVVLAKTIFQVAGSRLSTIRSRVDTYLGSLRLPDGDQAPLVQAIFDVYGGDGCMRHVVLDTFIRRDIVLTSAVAAYVTQQSANGIAGMTLLGTVHKDLWLYAVLEEMVDVAANKARLAITQRRVYDLDMRFDETIDIAGSLLAFASTEEEEAEDMEKEGKEQIPEQAHEDKQASMDEEDEDEEEDDDENRSSRLRRSMATDADDAGTGADLLTAAAAGDDAAVVVSGDDDVDTATETALFALQNCRETYATLLSALLRGVAQREQDQNEDQDAEQVDSWSVAAASLARHVLRVVHSAERAMNYRVSSGGPVPAEQRVVLSNVAKVVAEVGPSAQTFIDTVLLAWD